jgi:hypothetical protein
MYLWYPLIEKTKNLTAMLSGSSGGPRYMGRFFTIKLRFEFPGYKRKLDFVHLVICCPTVFQTPHFPPPKNLLSRQTFSLLLLYFFLTDFFPSTLVPHHHQLALYTSFLNDKLNLTLSFSPSCPTLSNHGLHLPFASLLFFCLADRMGWQQI